nr:hypothetical protein [Zelkova schneideriana]
MRSIKRKIYPRENLNSYILCHKKRQLVFLEIVGDYIIPTLISFVSLYLFGLPVVCFCESGDGEDQTSAEEANASSELGETFDLDVIAESWPSRTAGTSENQPEAVPVPPGNPVASPGEEAGPANQTLPVVPYPYPPDEVIGGDCVDAIQQRLLNPYSDPSSEVIQMMRIQAEDLFEVKVEIIQIMAGLDPTGDWMGKGARAFDNSRTATGEEPLERLYDLLEDLNRGGVQSEAYTRLKGKVHFRIVPEEHSSA